MRESRRQRREFHLLIPGSIIIIYDVDLFHLDIFIFIYIVQCGLGVNYFGSNKFRLIHCHVLGLSPTLCVVFFGHVDALPVLDQVEMIPRNFSASFE